MDFWNWTNTMYLVQHHFWWLLLAFLIGCWVGWTTCDTSRNAN
jgi:hypothetical protein